MRKGQDCLNNIIGLICDSSKIQHKYICQEFDFIFSYNMSNFEQTQESNLYFSKIDVVRGKWPH